MVTVRMTEEEYEAYLLYLKSIKMMLKAKKDFQEDNSIENYFSDPEIQRELDAGIEDAKAGRITYIDPHNLWENIK
jgi:hypothetical protein